MTVTDIETYQRQVTELLLNVVEGTGFALAGAGAIRAHGLTSRPTQDIDLFTASNVTAEAFQKAVEASQSALTEHGYRVSDSRIAPLLRGL